MSLVQPDIVEHCIACKSVIFCQVKTGVKQQKSNKAKWEIPVKKGAFDGEEKIHDINGKLREQTCHA
jgi:uncharacterized membrane protein YdbT with pleckstrin-like domain